LWICVKTQRQETKGVGAGSKATEYPWGIQVLLPQLQSRVDRLGFFARKKGNLKRRPSGCGFA